MLEASGIPGMETLLSQTVEHELIPGEKLCRVPELSPTLGMLDGKAGGFDGQRQRAGYFWTTAGLVLHVNASCGAGKGG